MDTMINNLASVDSLGLLRQAEAELSMVVHYGMSAIADDIDREHIAIAYALIVLLVKAQAGASSADAPHNLPVHRGGSR